MMKKSQQSPPIVWRIMRWVNRRMLSKYGPKSKAASRVLVLTTTGCRSGQQHQTPLQFEEVDGEYYVASARGVRSDWYHNLLACPQVMVMVGDKQFQTLARPMTDPREIADFLELRLKRHPHFMGIMLRMEGLPGKYSRIDLEKFAERLAIVALSPIYPGS